MALENVRDGAPARRYSEIAVDDVDTKPPFDANTLEKLPTTKSTLPWRPCSPRDPVPSGPTAPRSWATSTRRVASYSLQALWRAARSGESPSIEKMPSVTTRIAFFASAARIRRRCRTKALVDKCRALCTLRVAAIAPLTQQLWAYWS